MGSSILKEIWMIERLKNLQHWCWVLKIPVLMNWKRQKDMQARSLEIVYLQIIFWEVVWYLLEEVSPFKMFGRLVSLLKSKFSCGLWHKENWILEKWFKESFLILVSPLLGVCCARKVLKLLIIFFLLSCGFKVVE